MRTFIKYIRWTWRYGLYHKIRVDHWFINAILVIIMCQKIWNTGVGRKNIGLSWTLTITQLSDMTPYYW